MARYKAVIKSRWLAAQGTEARFWHGKEVLEREQNRLARLYSPILKRHTGHLKKESRILEIGCGPTCLAQFIAAGKKTYVDPLLDDFRRAYPGKLPEGDHFAYMAEDIPEPDASFDLILCINALDHVMNPELVLNEVERLLKPEGRFILGIIVFPGWLARLRYFIERFVPALRDEHRPYAYTLEGIQKTLNRHFSYQQEELASPPADSVTGPWTSERVFICRLKPRD
jgi:SAM-dependent methyltransferase